MAEKRKDHRGRILRDGESQRADRTYQFRYYVTTPKSRQGVRTVPMTDEVCEAFQNVIRKRLPLQQEHIVDGIGGFLFLTPTGLLKAAIHLENHMRKMLGRYEKRYGEALPNITPHCLRHTFCTRMAQAGMPDKERSAVLGHSKVSMTQDVYTHTNDEMVEKAFRKAAENL